MSEEFTDRLRLQLREAALREERRGGFARAATAAWTRPSLAVGSLAAAVAAGLVLVLGLWMVLSANPETAKPPVTGPRVLANVQVGNALGFSGRFAYGAVWLTDSDTGQILRVDPRTRRVTARIPAGGEVTMDAAAGSIWAARRLGQGGPLLRIDARTGKIVERIPMRTPGGGAFQGGYVLAGPSRVWVIGNEAIAIDPVSNRVVSQIRLGGDFKVVDAFVSNGELWLTRGDRSITRFDAVSGRRIGRATWPAKGFMFPYADKLVSVGSGRAALVDPKTGRALWTTRIPAQEEHDATIAGGRLLVQGTAADGREQIWALDPRTGRLVGRTAIPGFSVLRTLTVGRDVWATTAGGKVVIVRP
jgi:outer membrane protein assembly factor BamB